MKQAHVAHRQIGIAFVAVLLLVSLFAAAPAGAQTAEWSPIGSDFIGEPEDMLGRAVAMSADGQTMAISSPVYPNIPGAGVVRIYTRFGWSWQISAELVGAAPDQHLGETLALSGNGRWLVAGTRNGTVHIFRRNGASWFDTGSLEITPETPLSLTVDINHGGTMVVVGDPRHGGERAGRAQVFERNKAGWSQVGNDLALGVNGELFGSRVAMDASGQRLAISAPTGNSSIEYPAGPGRVAIYDLIDGDWVNTAFLRGAEDLLMFGWSLDMSADGSRVAADNWSREAFVFERDPVSMGWTKVWRFSENVLALDAGWFYNMTEVALSPDGSTVAVGALAQQFIGSGRFPHTSVHREVAGAWAQLGADISDANSHAITAQQMALDANGSTIVVGAGSVPLTYDRAGRSRVLTTDAPPEPPGDTMSHDDVSNDGSGPTLCCP